MRGCVLKSKCGINYTKDERIWEVDFCKGLAFLGMLFFHIIFDLHEWKGFNINYQTGIYAWIGDLSAILFIVLSGVSIHFSKNPLKRGLKIFGVAALITIITFFMGPLMVIWFGILHCLGVCAILYPLLKKVPTSLLVLGAIGIVLMQGFIQSMRVNVYFFVPLGIIPQRFASADYFPLIPWLGVYVLGMVVGRVLYKEPVSRFRHSGQTFFITKLGKHTLLLYIIHQPILYLLLSLI